MAVEYIGSSGASAAIASMTVAIPSEWELTEGDLLVYGLRLASEQEPGVPAGWTRIRSGGADATSTDSYYLVVGDTAPTSVTFTQSAAQLATYIVSAWRGAALLGQYARVTDGSNEAVADLPELAGVSVASDGFYVCHWHASSQSGFSANVVTRLSVGDQFTYRGRLLTVSPYDLSNASVDDPTATSVQGYRGDAFALGPKASGSAADRLRSNISETTGSLLEAVDARAVDASVSEAYTYAQELPATTLVTYREVLRTRDSATADFAYYPQPRQNIVMENQYTGLTILGRLARYYPPRIYNDVVSLGLSGIPAATATDCVNYVLTQWAADNDWLTFETVPDLRVPMPGLVPSDYGVGTGQVFASTIAIKQDGTNRRDALSILRDLLSPFPGTVVRQNSAGNLQIIPASGPDADETAFVTLDTKDLYSVTIGKPNEFDTINRCVVSSTGGAEQSTDVAVMQPAWFQLGSSYQFGRANWYSPPVGRTNLQPFDDATDDTLQEGLTTSSNFNLQKPVLWPISGDAIPAGDGISLVSSGAVEQVTIAWARYFNDSLVSSGTNGLTIVTDVIPFSGAWVDALSVSFTTGGESVFANIRMRWNETEQGIEIALGTAKLETDCFTGCNGVIIEFVLADASTAYAEASPVTASFGFVGDDPDILPGVNSADAVLESQTALGIVERRIDIRGYVFDAETLYQIARGYVLNNITPKVVRELDVAALSGYRVLFDNIGRLHELPSGDVGFLTGVTYTDDFVSGIVRKTATVEVRDLAAAGAVDTTTDYLLMDDGSFWQSDDGSLSEAP